MGDNDDDARRRRAKAREGWPGKVVRLDEVSEVEVLEGDPATLVAMVTELTLSAWAMSGRAIPDYRREETPGRVIRPSDVP